MKFSTLSVLASLVVSSDVAFASTLPTAGAVYFITNEPTGNFVVSADIGFDGKLTFANAVSARGVGAHVLPAITIADPLSTQGSVRVSSAGNLLATVNAGSDTVVVFAIDPQNPSTIEIIGSPVPSGGEFPVSVAFDNSGNRVCVLNGGAVNGVNCFSVDRKRGLIPIPNSRRLLGLNQTTPTTVPVNTLNDIIFSEDGTRLLITVTKDLVQTPGFIASWDVAKDGSLSETFTKSTAPSATLLPFSLTIIPGKNAIFLSDPTIGFDIFAFHGSSATSKAFPIPGQIGGCWTSYSSKTGNYYVADPFRSVVAEVHVDENLNGSVVKQYPQKNGTSAYDTDIATIANVDYLYILSPDSLTIEAHAAIAPGELVAWQSFDYSAGAARAGVTVSTANLQGMAAFTKKL